MVDCRGECVPVKTVPELQFISAVDVSVVNTFLRGRLIVNWVEVLTVRRPQKPAE